VGCRGSGLGPTRLSPSVGLGLEFLGAPRLLAAPSLRPRLHVVSAPHSAGGVLGERSREAILLGDLVGTLLPGPVKATHGPGAAAPVSASSSVSSSSEERLVHGETVAPFVSRVRDRDAGHATAAYMVGLAALMLP
jgi:hypothetical protein